MYLSETDPGHGSPQTQDFVYTGTSEYYRELPLGNLDSNNIW